MKIKDDSKKNTRVLMIGPGRNVRGGISSVVNQYFDSEISDTYDMDYIETMREGSKVFKLFMAIKAYVIFYFWINKFDIIHIHMASHNSFYRKKVFIDCAKKRGKKIIIHIHGGGFEKFYNKEVSDNQRSVIKKTINKADALVVLTENWRLFFANIIPNDRIFVISNSVKIPQYTVKNYSVRNIVYLGKMREKKGTYDLIRSMRRVVGVMSDAKLFLAGDGEVVECKELVRKLDLCESIHFEGWISGSQKSDLLINCVVFAFPSYFEGMPMALLEAMSYGLVVVASNIDGIKEFIDDGVDGFLIEPGDEAEIANTIIKAFSGNLNAIGNNARKKIIENFNLDNSINKIKDLYNGVLFK